MVQKRQRMEADDESITSPLTHKNKEDKCCTSWYKGRKTSIVNLVSDSQHDTDQSFKGEKENFDDWNRSLSKAKKDDYEGLTQRVDKLETGLDNIKQSLDDLKEAIFSYLPQTGNAHVTPPTKSIPLSINPLSTPRSSGMTDTNTAARIVKQLSEREELCKEERRIEEGDKDCEPIAKETVRKLFAPSRKNKGNSTPLVVTSTPTGYYITSRTRQVTPSKLVEQFIPNWLSSMFKPIKLNSNECDLASYIFGCSANEIVTEEEIMVTTNIEYCDGTRKLLQCLKPKQLLDQDIIDLVACMLTCKEKKKMINTRIWFLPTTFSQFVVAWNTTTHVAIKNFQNKFMGNVDQISKIFLPVHDYEHSHWFLLVIDFAKKELIYLDSLPSSSALAGRMRSIKKLALFMEDLLMDPSFYSTDITNKPIISEFKLVIPDGLGVQEDYSNDCGIWVIIWMMQMGANEYKIYVDEGTRLRIALDLILDPYNKLNHVVLLRSLHHKEGGIKKAKESG